MFGFLDSLVSQNQKLSTSTRLGNFLLESSSSMPMVAFNRMIKNYLCFFHCGTHLESPPAESSPDEIDLLKALRKPTWYNTVLRAVC